MSSEADIARVRDFNRLVTRQVGALNDRYLGRRPLGELRVLHEIGLDGATPRDVRARLGLDSGYVSRMIRALERDGLAEQKPEASDRRSKRLGLTAAGRSELEEIDRISNAMAASVLDPLTPEQRERMLAAQADVRRLLAISMVSIEPEEPASADAKWCLGHYYGELRERFEGSFEPEETPPWERFLIARLSGQPAGCGGVVAVRPGVAEIKRMWIDRPHRGMGIGSRLLAALEGQALALGHTTVLLDTNRSLLEAQAMYGARGYVETARYNDNPYADFWFEKHLS